MQDEHQQSCSSLAVSSNDSQYEGGSKGTSPRRKRNKATNDETDNEEMDGMQDYIKSKLHKAGTLKNTKKEFVGIHGNKDPDNVLHKMVEKIV